MRPLLPVSLFVLAACAPERPTFGPLTLDATETSFAVKAGARALLESFPGGSKATAPVATRVGRARVEMQYGSWRFTEGRSEWREGQRFQWTGQEAGEAAGAWRDASGAPVVFVSARSPGTGELALTFEAADPQTNRLSLAFRCEAADRFLGFGAQVDAVDHHGHTIAAWTSEPGIGKELGSDEPPDLWFLVGSRHASSFPVPTWTSSRGYQGLVETDRRVVFEVCSAQRDVFRVEVWGPRFTLWLFEGTPAQALTRATARVLGRQPRPPPLAFAPWNDAIFGSAEVRRVAAVLREQDIPSSALWTEDFRGGEDAPTGYRLVEEWALDRGLYPDAEALAAELSAQGFSWQAYFNTFLVQGTRVHAEAEDGGHLVGAPDGGAYLFSGVTFQPTGLADLSRPETREWVKGALRAALDVGFTGWMADFGEWLPHDAVLASGEDAWEAHNRYPREWAKLNSEVLAERAGDGVQRTFFSRAGWVGSNPVTPVVWAGDQRTSFQRDDGLFTVVPMGINLGLAGVSMYAHDIAGYQSATNPPSTKELFFRWTALGALTPVMRTHHGIDARRNWRFDSDAETLAHYRRWARLHVRLFPYLDAHAAEAEATGLPLVRALPLEFPEDERGWTVDDEYLLGRALLVAPVVDEGATSRAVYLPAGEWVSWDGASRVTGPVELAVAAPVTELPLFVRAGAAIPLLPEAVDTLVPAAAPTVDLDDVRGERWVRLYAGGESTFGERDGTRYVVQRTEGTTFAEAGVPLPDCATASQRGCVDRAGTHPVARLTGAGPLDFPGGRLEVASASVTTWSVEIL